MKSAILIVFSLVIALSATGKAPTAAENVQKLAPVDSDNPTPEKKTPPIKNAVPPKARGKVVDTSTKKSNASLKGGEKKAVGKAPSSGGAKIVPVPEIFVIPDRIKNDVAFWAQVYREWDTHQVIFYDEKSKVVYDILNLPKVPNEISAPKFRKEVQARLTNIRDALNSLELDDKRETSVLEKNLLEIIKKKSLKSELDLATRLRYQSGLRSRFEYGLRVSGRYADEMKAILRSQGLPEDLLALVFVESLFQLSAVSSAGASGPWGIMRETAMRTGILVNNFTDERLDPLVATWCAAQYLKKAKETLSEWSLAITSYNYGYAGMMRAVNNWGKDFEKILDNHDGNWFGYASKSYYAEFLAARDTFINQDKYFPGLKKESRWEYELVHVERPVEVTDLYAHKVIGRDDLATLNPSLTRRTLSGLEVIPGQYHVRVPKKKSSHFYQQIKKISASRRNAALDKISFKYLAKGRESLATIARNFGISPLFLSERMGKPLNYQPKGPVIIRSQAHRFFSLDDINRQMASSFAKPSVQNVVDAGGTVR